MKKKILIIIALILFIPTVKAEAEIPAITDYIDGVAYSDGIVLTDTWAYDLSTNMYVKLDINGLVLLQVEDPNDDPTAQIGKINIKANVPKNLEDKTITISLSTIPYNYSFELNKDNNFTIDEKIIAASYNVEVDISDDTNIYDIYYPPTINIYANKLSTINLDYSKYYKEEVKEEKKEIDSRKVILIIFGSVIALFFLIIILMFIKARNV